MSTSPKPPSAMRLLTALIAIGLGGYAWYANDTENQNRSPTKDQSSAPRAETREESRSKSAAKATKNDADSAKAGQGSAPSAPPPTVIKNVTIKDQSGKVVYRGSIDLQPTLNRIAAGKKLTFRNDGIVFQNREGRLPKKESGFYHEWVHPTKGLGGPGPQRVVTGKGGEIYYTHDHYRSFQKIAVAEPRAP